MTHTPVTSGADHVGLTVPDLAKAKTFFIDTLGFEQVGEMPTYPMVAVSDGAIRLTLWQASDPASAAAFERKNNIGLHHIAFAIDTLEHLNELHETLKITDGVVMEFAPEALGPGPTQHMMCAIPGGIRVEFIVRLA